MIYKNEKTAQISFPLGGIGAGCIGLGGNGRLIDWEIYNRANKGSLNGMSHFAVKAEKDGQLIDTRILQGDLHPPYTGEYKDSMINTFDGYGFGPRRENLCGLPHFRDYTFTGEFPLAQISFHDTAFPGKVSLNAWSPFIPGNDDDSSLPAAFFEITITNDTGEAIDYSTVGILANPFKTPTVNNRYQENGKVKQLVLSHGGDPTELEYGDLSLSTNAQDISFQEYWFHGGWFDDLEVYWHDLNAPGKFRNRHYNSAENQRNTGLIAAHFRLEPGQSQTVNYVISWNIPNRKNDWNSDADKMAADNQITNSWKNYYATLWDDSAVSGNYALSNFTRLKNETMLFHDTLFSSTLPEAVMDGISANISILKSPTCLRLEDGTFYGWEGVSSHAGSCEGSCTHVWNYAMALPFLFPALERSMRSAHYHYSIDENGGNHFRLMLPLGIKATTEFFRPCVDGQYGEVMKAWREWKISGDTEWLRKLWPAIKKTVEYAWNDKNFDRWDPERSGVITGRQHHTLDMELFGPSAWLNGHYLGALKAAAEMADLFGDKDFAATCRDIFRKGKTRTDKELFNGEYYCQNVDLDDHELIKSFIRPNDAIILSGDSVEKAYWDAEHQQIKYQISGGCEIDMHLPQWYASIYGLGEIFDPQKNRRTLEAIFRNNFRESMRNVANQWRNYCINDEAGVQMCTWPKPEDKPVIPIPYASETMHGFEWSFAGHLILCGMIEEGMKVVRAIRDRYDGQKRNPWNEFECGSNYARSMASYAMLNAFSGFRFDTTRNMIGFNPAVTNTDFRCFWSLGVAWGEYQRTGQKESIRVKYGSLPLRRLSFAASPCRLLHEERKLAFTLNDNGEAVMEETIVLKSGEELTAVTQ